MEMGNLQYETSLNNILLECYPQDFCKWSIISKTELKSEVNAAAAFVHGSTPTILTLFTDVDVKNMRGKIEGDYPPLSFPKAAEVTWSLYKLSNIVFYVSLYHLIASGLTKLNINLPSLNHRFSLTWKESLGGVAFSLFSSICFEKLNKKATMHTIVDRLEKKVAEGKINK